MCPPGHHRNGFVATHTSSNSYIMQLMQQTVEHVPKCMSCHKAVVVITGRAHCFHGCIYIAPILLLRYLSTLCVIYHLWLIISMLLAWLVEPPLVYWYQQCVAVHYVRKWCMNCHKAVVVITGRASLWHIYCAHFAFVRFEHSVCDESLVINYIYTYVYI